MTAKDFWTLLISNLTLMILAFEAFHGLEFAADFLYFLVPIDLIICNSIIKKYISINTAGRQCFIEVDTFSYSFKTYREAKAFCDENRISYKEIYK